MARYDHLAIYKAAFDLNVYLEKTVRYFSRYHKYTLGTELRNRAREIVKLIVRANNSCDKLPILFTLREELEQLKLTVRLCKEVKAFHNFNSFQVTINHVITVSKQNEGWITYLSEQDAGQGQNPDS
jgi:hypothetical protein